MPLTQAQARSRLAAMVASATDPALTDAELDELLAQNARAAVWAAGTAYTVGARVVPAVWNGRLYVCRKAGSSQTTAPSWGEAGDHYLGREVADGSALVWEDAGPAYTELWDLHGAARDGWLRKAAKASERTYFGTNGQMYSQQQVFDHCMQMAARFQPAMVF